MVDSKLLNFMAAYGNVNNPEACIDALKRLTGVEEVDVKYINSYASSVSGAIRYFDANVIELREEHDIKYAEYMWVDTGYKYNKYSIYASFYKQPIGWMGAFIGTEEKLRHRLTKYTYKENTVSLGGCLEGHEGEEKHTSRTIITDEEYKNLDKNKFCIELYKRLLVKEHWATAKKGQNRLSKYLEAIVGKVQNNIKKEVSDGYLFNSDKTKIVINTGLLDEFMSDIYVCFDIEENTFINPSIVENKVDLVRKGFEREQTKNMPRPVKFYNDPRELLFNATIEDFDLEDNRRLHHIINERRSRFPDKYSRISADVLSSKIKAAIERAVKLSERDYKYVVPMYTIVEDKIAFLVPLHLDKSIEETPELTLVIDRIEGFYMVMTILTPDDAYDHARVIARPGSSWLQPE